MPRSPEKNRQIKDERRAGIHAAALNLFAANGLHATRISDIAAAAGMAQGLLYHYYASKEEIFTALIRSSFDSLIGAARGLAAQEMPAGEKIRFALEHLLAQLDQGEAFALRVLFIAQAGVADSTPPEAKAVIAEFSMVPYKIVSAIMAEGQQQGTIRPGDPDELALLFWTTIKGLALHRAAHGAAYRSPDVETIAPLFLLHDLSKPS